MTVSWWRNVYGGIVICKWFTATKPPNAAVCQSFCTTTTASWFQKTVCLYAPVMSNGIDPSPAARSTAMEKITLKSSVLKVKLLNTLLVRYTLSMHYRLCYTRWDAFKMWLWACTVVRSTFCTEEAIRKYSLLWTKKRVSSLKRA